MYVLKQADIAHFQEGLRRMERSGATIEKYGRDLAAFYRWLPGDKAVTRERVLDYKDRLCRSYAPASVNSMLSALRAFFQFAGWKDFGVKLLRIQRRVFISQERELSRAEYQRLVETAERRGSRRLSILLQLLASTGIRASEVRYITVEAARRGRAEISLKGKSRSILLPGKLCRKLLSYARGQKIASGQIMLTRSGKPLNRKEIWALLKNLCAAAGVEPGKVFPITSAISLPAPSIRRGVTSSSWPTCWATAASIPPGSTWCPPDRSTGAVWSGWGWCGNISGRNMPYVSVSDCRFIIPDNPTALNIFLPKPLVISAKRERNLKKCGKWWAIF